jgi:hypothetical protein
VNDGRLEPDDAALRRGVFEPAVRRELESATRVDPSTIVGVPLTWGSEWVAIEAITQGSVVEWDPETYASRWRSVRGIPLVWSRPDQRERILVGAAMLTSTRPLGSLILEQAEQLAPASAKTIDVALHDQLVRLWD